MASDILAGVTGPRAAAPKAATAEAAAPTARSAASEGPASWGGDSVDDFARMPSPMEQNAAGSSSKSVRQDHAMRHLIAQNVIPGTLNSAIARKAWGNLVSEVLTNPTKTFKYMLPDATPTTAFYKVVGGKDIVLLVADQAKGKVLAGQVIGGWVPSWRMNPDIMLIINNH